MAASTHGHSEWADGFGNGRAGCRFHCAPWPDARVGVTRKCRKTIDPTTTSVRRSPVAIQGSRTRVAVLIAILGFCRFYSCCGGRRTRGTSRFRPPSFSRGWRPPRLFPAPSPFDPQSPLQEITGKYRPGADGRPVKPRRGGTRRRPQHAPGADRRGRQVARATRTSG